MLSTDSSKSSGRTKARRLLNIIETGYADLATDFEAKFVASNLDCRECHVVIDAVDRVGPRLAREQLRGRLQRALALEYPLSRSGSARPCDVRCAMKPDSRRDLLRTRLIRLRPRDVCNPVAADARQFAVLLAIVLDNAGKVFLGRSSVEEDDWNSRIATLLCEFRRESRGHEKQRIDSVFHKSRRARLRLHGPRQ